MRLIHSLKSNNTLRLKVEMDPIDQGVIEQCMYLECTRLAEIFDLVNVLVATVVSVAWYTLRILVCESASEGLDDSEGGEVLGGYEFDSSTLPSLLLLNEIMDLRVHHLEGCVAPYGNWIHGVPSL